jgi:acetoacetate decarboxylase
MDSRPARYDMPVAFGPSLMPDATIFGRVHMISMTYPTTADALAPLVPPHYALSGKPIVTVSRVTYDDVDYLRGRGYNEVTVGIRVRYDGGAERLEGAHLPVIWVDNQMAMISGREYGGYAKILGQLTPVTTEGTTLGFELRDPPALLLRGHVVMASPVTGVDLEALRHRMRHTVSLGWKYIARAGGGVDADYPVYTPLTFDFHSAWTGPAELDWMVPTTDESPASARIVETLATIPRLGECRGFVGIGSGGIDRAGTRPLAPRGPSSDSETR